MENRSVSQFLKGSESIDPINFPILCNDSCYFTMKLIAVFFLITVAVLDGTGASPSSWEFDIHEGLPAESAALNSEARVPIAGVMDRPRRGKYLSQGPQRHAAEIDEDAKTTLESDVHASLPTAAKSEI